MQLTQAAAEGLIGWWFVAESIRSRDNLTCFLVEFPASLLAHPVQDALEELSNGRIANLGVRSLLIVGLPFVVYVFIRNKDSQS